MMLGLFEPYAHFTFNPSVSGGVLEHRVHTWPSFNIDVKMQTSEIVTDPFLQSVLNVSTSTRQQCMNLVDLAEANAIVGSEQPPPEAQLELSRQQKLLYSFLSQLRGSNRDAINKVRNTKQTTAEARQEIDRLHLQLQNLYYEERHLRGEIAACGSYEYVLESIFAHI